MSSMQRLRQEDNRDTRADPFKHMLILSYKNSVKQFTLRVLYITTISETR